MGKCLAGRDKIQSAVEWDEVSFLMGWEAMGKGKSVRCGVQWNGMRME